MRRGHTSDPDHAGVHAASSLSVSGAGCKEEVDRQIAELLSMGLIRRSESDSPMTIPIAENDMVVCALPVTIAI